MERRWPSRTRLKVHLLPASNFVEFREGGHFIAGTRISVDSIAYGVLCGGQTLEEFSTTSRP